ncbi:Coiled-coil domain-containing protein 16 [Drepanopeziza brunnea f. sp. 'multigermtubi' MB_m1]|uniref:Coiled-coil domain-containing protein 16 n=2 Tax=Drepanopeziza brunnea f. sp. 'multigermtubi' TaxID=698441 RepID=K1W9N9_MARBU|nr:Coiled-coil domain-containing protein 16 [Drepanopeziza brunnea f. sp. 'multigermtubi' MB_m1]EKD13970.1 Coiled-coil domain-containing protein 16 [Drepanopeziza brunnea f. sp. 'multigermtubi' MB_m1]
MADVRSLLKSERAARRIQHQHASYTPTGTLLCTVCHLQLKSETLWDGHLRSAGHMMRAQKAQESEASAPEVPSKKRKASDEDGASMVSKRSKPANGLPEGFFDTGSQQVEVAQLPMELHIPSRPATPSKTLAPELKKPEVLVDEDEWASFQADIATAEAQVQIANDAVISAPAMSAAEVAKKTVEEEYMQRKEKMEAEIEGDKEDAARKMEEELDEMESLEARVKRLREKREGLRRKESVMGLNKPVPALVETSTLHDDEDDEEDEDEDEDEDDDWDGFRMKG